MPDKKIESLAYRLKDYESLRALFAELNFEFADEPVNKEHWNQDQIEMVQEAKIIAKKDDFRIYYIQTNTDSLNQWKGIATKIIKENNGLCLICSHNPSGFKWIFSSLSRHFSKSFTETRHVPIDIRPDIGVPQTFVVFLEKIKVNKDSTASSIALQISGAFDSFAIAIHDELTVNVFEALKSLSEGIILDESNGLTLNEDTLEEIREPIFILLYRIIFILYAEDRGVFPVEHKIYHEKFSFKWLKQEWLLKSENQKKISEYQVHNRLWNFFRLIELGSKDLGYDSNEFFMRSYYGRIFDKTINQKLEKWKIKNQYLLDAISLLTRTRDKHGNYFFLDYSALETRHLGSIYEHLLEYHLTVKGKKIADLPDQQERKTSASYYTPQYVVDYIVNNAIEPLIEKIVKNTSDKFIQIEKILSLNILDPAMGSGHFLIGVVNYIARRICEIEGDEITEQHLNERKRDVVRRCVYGVDINPLAVDLAMVSLWLETLSSDRPLSFLSAHLKCGNSLVGSKMDILFDKQTTLMESQKGREKFKKTIKDFIMFENLEDDSANAVKTKTEKFQNIQSKGSIYYDLKFLLDCKVAEKFGVKIPHFADYKTKIGENSLDFFTDDSFQKIKKLSTDNRFFHWELEFLDVFFNDNGDKKKEDGFDAVIGNPPYIRNLIMTDSILEYFTNEFETATGHYDFYVLFTEKGMNLVNTEGIFSFIMPNKFFQAKYGKGLRHFLNTKSLINITDFGHLQIFSPSATTYTCIIFGSRKNYEKFEYVRFNDMDLVISHLNNIGNITDSEKKFFHRSINKKELPVGEWVFGTETGKKLLDALCKDKKTLGDITSGIFQGLATTADPVYIMNYVSESEKEIVLFSKVLDKEIQIEKEIVRPILKGSQIRRYYLEKPTKYFIFPYELKNDKAIVINPDVFSKKFPKTLEYLKKNRVILDKREQDEKTKIGKLQKSPTWYGYSQEHNLNKFEGKKIITQVLSLHPQFALDKNENNYFVGGGNAGGYGIVLEKELIKNDPYLYHYVLGLLNSKLEEYVLRHISTTFRGGYVSYARRFIEKLPIPSITTNEDKKIKMEIAKNVETLLDILENNNASTKNKKENDFQKDENIIDLECKIDVEVFKLFKLSKVEIEHILDYLDVEYNIKEKIIQYHLKK